jgi:hypothetical protein
MVVAGQLMPIIEQLGLFEQVAAVGKRLHSSLMVKENKETMLFMDFLPSEELYVSSSLLKERSIALVHSVANMSLTPPLVCIAYLGLDTQVTLSHDHSCTTCS